MTATAKDLRFHSKELIETVSRGEDVIITYRGNPCARLTSCSKKRVDHEEHDELFGIWKDFDETKNVSDYVRSLRKGS